MRAGDLIERLSDAVAGTHDLDGLFLAGSFGRGTEDAWSDVDLVGLAAPDRHQAIMDWWRDWLEAQEHLIYFKVLPRGGALSNAITQSWLRIDLHLPDTGLGTRTQDGLRPIYDPRHLHAGLAHSLPERQPNAGYVEYAISEFIRILGLTPVGLGRREYVVMVMGVGLLRDLLIGIMQEEVPIADRGGMLHLSRVLPEEDMRLLQRLPYPGPEPTALVEAQLALAEAFFPRARALAARLGIAWPIEFETVTRAHLAGAIGRAPETLWPLA